jgi:hypothetical protein
VLVVLSVKGGNEHEVGGKPKEERERGGGSMKMKNEEEC